MNAFFVQSLSITPSPSSYLIDGFKIRFTSKSSTSAEDTEVDEVRIEDMP